MKTFKPNDSEIAMLANAAAMIKEGNAALAAGKKSSDAGKEAIAQWLNTHRDCNVDLLPIGEIVNIERVAIIEVASQNRFDEKKFALECPQSHASYVRPLAVRKYKPLV